MPFRLQPQARSKVAAWTEISDKAANKEQRKEAALCNFIEAADPLRVSEEPLYSTTVFGLQLFGDAQTISPKGEEIP